MCARNELPEAVVVCNLAVKVASVTVSETLGDDLSVVVFCEITLDVDTVSFVNDIVAAASFVGKDKRELVVIVVFSDAMVDGVELVEFGEVGVILGKLIFALMVDVC